MTIGTRTFLELRVGRSHTVDVLLHLRRADVEWFRSSPEHKKELFRLLSQHVLFNECDQEIEKYHNFQYGQAPPVEIGEKNKPKGKKGGKKRKGAPAAEPVAKPEKPKRDVRHVFGDGMKVMYRVEDVKDNEGTTLIFPKKTSEQSAPRFRQLPKLSKRFILWCYPKNDDENATDSPQQEERGGFPRPEMVPITSLFRAPPTENE